MDIHEYQAKALFRAFGIRTLKGDVATSPEEAMRTARDLGGGGRDPFWLVKAQVHAGGRGLGGGIKKAKSLGEVEQVVENMLGKKLVTAQTGAEGKTIRQVLIEEGRVIEKEFYLALLVDRKWESLSLVASSEGGTSIEELAHKAPEKIMTLSISPSLGCLAFHSRCLLKAFQLPFCFLPDLQALLQSLYQLMITKEASLIEINPLARIKEGDREVLIPLDAKVSIDDNALFRQEDMKVLRDFRELPLMEQKALAHDLSFVKLSGHIGCLVNGAGLAMATMDIVQLKGSHPANFLDVGGGVNKEKIDIAFQILKEDPAVKGILVNIFGGIVKCDLIAEGLVRAIKNLNITLPVVVRLEGTNAKRARTILDQSGLDLHFADNLSLAAEKIVDLTSRLP